MGFATAVSLGWGNLVAEVEDAPEAFVEGHCPAEPRGRSAVSRTQSRRGRIEQRRFEGWRTAAKVKVPQAGVRRVDNKRRRTEAGSRANIQEGKLGFKRERDRGRQHVALNDSMRHLHFSGRHLKLQSRRFASKMNMINAADDIF